MFVHVLKPQVTPVKFNKNIARGCVDMLTGASSATGKCFACGNHHNSRRYLPCRYVSIKKHLTEKDENL